MIAQYQDKNIVLFDGVCNLCNEAVNFLIDQDRHHLLLFASLQSAAGQEILSHFQMDTNDFDTFLFLSKGKLYSRSTGALEVMRVLGGGWRWLYVFKIVPAFLRDAVYSIIARYRYQLFGKRDSCRMPTPELKAKFL